jgi:hypothetical protein
MLVLQTPPAASGAYNLDRQTLLLLAALAFMLAIWLLYRILRSKPIAADTIEMAGLEADATLVTRVPPPPLPKIEKILSRLDGEYPEFCNIVREVQTHTTPQIILAQSEIRRGFTHLETLLMKADRAPSKGSLGLQAEAKALSAETRREAKATILTIIRLIEDIEGVRDKSGPFIDDQLDHFLERI